MHSQGFLPEYTRLPAREHFWSVSMSLRWSLWWRTQEKGGSAARQAVLTDAATYERLPLHLAKPTASTTGKSFTIHSTPVCFCTLRTWLASKVLLRLGRKSWFTFRNTKKTTSHPKKIPKPAGLFPHPFLHSLKTPKPGYKFLPDCFQRACSDVPGIMRVNHRYYSLHCMT